MYTSAQQANQPVNALSASDRVLIALKGWSAAEMRAAFGFAVFFGTASNPADVDEWKKTVFAVGDYAILTGGLIWRCITAGLGSAAVWTLDYGTLEEDIYVELTAATEGYLTPSGDKIRGSAIVDVWMRKNAVGTDTSDNTESIQVTVYRDASSLMSDAKTTRGFASVEFNETNVDGAVEDDVTVTLDSVAGLAEGDRIAFNDETNGLQIRTIEAISGSDITINRAIDLDDDANASKILNLDFDFFNSWAIGLLCANAVDAMYAQILEG